MRVAVIGGSSSIGRQVVGLLAARGDEVLATWAREPFEAPAGVRSAHLDLRDDASIVALAASIGTAGARLDAVVSFSGVLHGKSLGDHDAASIHETMAVNVAGQARLIQLLLPLMAAGAQVLLTSSISGTHGSYDPIYAASKAAQIGLVKSLAAWHGKQVRFNCIAPSLVEGSTMDRSMAEERRRHHRATSPTGALLALGDLAQVVVDLLGPHWRHLNGAVIALDGASRP